MPGKSLREQIFIFSFAQILLIHILYTNTNHVTQKKKNILCNMSSAKLAFGVEIELLLKPLPSLSARLDKLCPSKDWQNTFEDVKQKELAAQGKGPAVEAEAKNNAGQIRALLRQQLALCLANYDSWLL